MWKGTIINKNSGFLNKSFNDGMIASFWWLAEGEHGVGGPAGIKNEGTDAVVA